MTYYVLATPSRLYTRTLYVSCACSHVNRSVLNTARCYSPNVLEATLYESYEDAMRAQSRTEPEDPVPLITALLDHGSDPRWSAHLDAVD